MKPFVAGKVVPSILSPEDRECEGEGENLSNSYMFSAIGAVLLAVWGEGAWGPEGANKRPSYRDSKMLPPVLLMMLRKSCLTFAPTPPLPLSPPPSLPLLPVESLVSLDWGFGPSLAVGGACFPSPTWYMRWSRAPGSTSHSFVSAIVTPPVSELSNTFS